MKVCILKFWNEKLFQDVTWHQQRDLGQSWTRAEEKQFTAVSCNMYFICFLQLGTSSRAIHGGAYFSAVSGRKFNLTTVLRPCWPLACCWMFFSRPLSLLYWISLNCQVPLGWHCIFRWICLQNAKMDFFPTVLIAFPKTDLDFTDCCMNLFSTMTMFMFLCKYDRPFIILFVVFPSPLKRRSTQSSSCLIFAIK